MKRLIALILTAVLLCACVLTACADINLNVLANSNPLPEIYEKVSPAVAVLARVSNVWDANTDTVTKKEEGGGSAVLVDVRGYFLTNYHVVEDCDELEIRFGGGVTYEALVVGFDAASDVAVVKVDEELNIEPVKIGSSSALRVGELICVIGTPVDEKAMYNTLTSGIVAGLNREDADYDAQRAVGLIQVDAAVNPGNSGGALLNMQGELVGIPFMKYMGYYYKDANGEELIVYENLAFAVPMDVAWPIAESIINTGVYNRPRIGVSVMDNNGPEEALKNYPPAGLKISEVEKGGSGAKAGLRVGDVITHINGTRVYNFREYTKIIDKLSAGDTFTVTIARYFDKDGEALKKIEILELTVKLEMID
ncbi:MAG: trypsin-like peptidase domain-containing protein [Clostridia bacterium]|nr:trypsin-like peptidase domain-containing protein [Clostridia bacterium]